MFTTSFGNYSAGVHENISFSDYVKIPAVNKSSLALIANSPEDCLASLEGRYRKDSTGFTIGSALDDIMTANMTQEAWTDAHPVASTCEALLASGERKGQACGYKTLNKYGIAGWLCGKHDKAMGQPTAKATLTADDLVSIVGMKNALMDSDCKILFEGMKRSQLTALWIDEETGLHCKARLDGVSVCQLPGYDAPCSVRWDLKTMRQDTMRGWERDANGFSYYLQDAHYTAGANALAKAQGKEPTQGNFIFAVACSIPNGPLGRHDAFLWTYDDATRAAAELERAHLMRKLKACLVAGCFPPKKISGIQTGNCPVWNFTHTNENQ